MLPKKNPTDIHDLVCVEFRVFVDFYSVETISVHPAPVDFLSKFWPLFIPVMFFALMAILCYRYWSWSVEVHLSQRHLLAATALAPKSFPQDFFFFFIVFFLLHA